MNGEERQGLVAVLYVVWSAAEMTWRRSFSRPLTTGIITPHIRIRVRDQTATGVGIFSDGN